MTEPARKEWMCVGKVTGAYGIKGWVRVHAYTDQPIDFLTLERWHIAAPGREESKTPVAAGGSNAGVAVSTCQSPKAF